MSWASVDVDAGILRVESGKGRKARTVPLSEPLRASLRALKRESASGLCRRQARGRRLNDLLTRYENVDVSGFLGFPADGWDNPFWRK